MMAWVGQRCLALSINQSLRQVGELILRWDNCPCPISPVALGRMAPIPHLGDTEELVLKVWKK